MICVECKALMAKRPISVNDRFCIMRGSLESRRRLMTTRDYSKFSILKIVPSGEKKIETPEIRITFEFVALEMFKSAFVVQMNFIKNSLIFDVSNIIVGKIHSKWKCNN